MAKAFGITPRPKEAYFFQRVYQPEPQKEEESIHAACHPMCRGRWKLHPGSTGQSLAEITVEPSDKGAVVKVDGKLFTEYVTGYGEGEILETPILWPILGPSGKAITRSYPMAEGHKSERKDHPHHRSLWFNHGDVNGNSFWHREPIKHVRFVEMASGETGKIVTENQWLNREGEIQCCDQRTFVFGADGDSRWIDVEIVVKAGDAPVKFGDTKEGTFGVRVAGTMKVDAAKPNARHGVPETDPSWGGTCRQLGRTTGR